jgi:hypothetical protein
MGDHARPIREPRVWEASGAACRIDWEVWSGAQETSKDGSLCSPRLWIGLSKLMIPAMARPCGTILKGANHVNEWKGMAHCLPLRVCGIPEL